MYFTQTATFELTLCQKIFGYKFDLFISKTVYVFI